jgi:hypothetical protein
VSVVCCQDEVSATSWSLVQIVQRSPTECGASLCVIYKPRKWGDRGPQGAVAPKTNKQTKHFRSLGRAKYGRIHKILNYEIRLKNLGWGIKHISVSDYVKYMAILWRKSRIK